jgi:predicted GNAT family N-acyltransferase
VKLQTFDLQALDWSRESDRRVLQELRHTVFVLEQGVPPEREQDMLDGSAWHLLARDASGRPVGCGRLTGEHTIGRLAVLAHARGQGVGVGLLRGLIAQARARGWAQVSLTALAGATAFYAREGFTPIGKGFAEAGLPHQTMQLKLSTAPVPSVPARDLGLLPAGNAENIAIARLQLLRHTRRQLAIQLPRLERDAFTSPAEWEELRRIAASGRGAQIRILLHDPAAALRDGHRLIALMQRLPSILRVRMPVEEVDLASSASCLLTDSGGYLLQPDAGRPLGRAALADRAACQPLEQHFNAMWERAAPASMLQPLDL